MDNILNFFTNNFTSCVWLAVVLVALIPTLESKIAIPFAMNPSIWGLNALPAWQAFLFAWIGSILPSIFVMLIARKIKAHTTGFVTSYVNHRYSVKTSLIEKQTSSLKKYFMICGFVAIPLPLTGVWAGSLIAGLTNLKPKYCFVSITIGAAISCGIITLLCAKFENSIGYILLISLLLVVIFIGADFILNLLQKLKNKKAE